MDNSSTSTLGQLDIRYCDLWKTIGRRLHILGKHGQPAERLYLRHGRKHAGRRQWSDHLRRRKQNQHDGRSDIHLRRRRKACGEVQRHAFWTGVRSDPLSESDLSGNINEEYASSTECGCRGLTVPAELCMVSWRTIFGSSRMSVVPSGANTLMVEEDLDYTPYGILASGTATDHYEFTGKERDAESGNDYFGARYYASSMGRWMHPDKPFADQHLTDPQSWNLYVYVRNNPLIHKDDAGRACSALNGSSGYCQRADLYGNFDLLVGGKTRFYAATSAISQSLANVAIPGLGRIGTCRKREACLTTSARVSKPSILQRWARSFPDRLQCQA